MRCGRNLRSERPNVGGVSIRSRNGAPSRKGCVVNAQTTKASNKRVHPITIMGVQPMAPHTLHPPLLFFLWCSVATLAPSQPFPPGLAVHRADHQMTNCNGGGQCGTCAVQVEEAEGWDPRSDWEAGKLKVLIGQPRVPPKKKM